MKLGMVDLYINHLTRTEDALGRKPWVTALNLRAHVTAPVKTPYHLTMEELRDVTWR